MKINNNPYNDDDDEET